MVEIRIPQRVASAANPHRGMSAPRIGPAIETAFAAGSFVLLTMIAIGVLAYDESPWKLLRMMAATVAGPGVIESLDGFDMAAVAMGVGIHYALSFLYVLAFAGITRELSREAAPIMGAACGIALYFANLYGFTYLFPWFAEMRTADMLFAHVIFGVTAACIYADLAEPPSGAHNPHE